MLPASSLARVILRENQSFTATTPASNGKVAQCGPWCGVRISRIALHAIQPAIAKMNTATASAANGSALPWPNG